MVDPHGDSAPPNLDSLLNRIDEASKASRSAVGSVTKYIKTIQDHLLDKIGDLCTGNVELPVDDSNPHGDYFEVLRWDGRRLIHVSGIAGDYPEDFNRTPALETSSSTRLEIADKLPQLIELICNSIEEQSNKYGKLADQARATPPPPPPSRPRKKTPPPPPLPPSPPMTPPQMGGAK